MGANKRKIINGTPVSRKSKLSEMPANLFTNPPPTNIPSTSNSKTAASTTDILLGVKNLYDNADKTDPQWAMIGLLVSLVEQLQLQNEQQREIIAGLADKLEAQEDPAELKERKRSIVVAGMPEADGAPSARREADKRRLSELMDELDAEVEVVATYRMGEQKQGKPRLTKVVLGNSGQQRTVLRAARNLRHSTVFKGVFVRPSMTKEERDEDFALRKELAERRKQGEKVILRGWPGQKREIVAVREGN